jgi:transketolase
MSEIYNTLKNRTYDGPVVILARTRKGYGVDFAEDKEGFHGVAFSKEQLAQAYASLEKRFPAAAQYTGNFKWQPTLPPAENIVKPESKSSPLAAPIYKIGQSVATRTAFGEALVALGLQHDDIVVLDADVQNSTMTQQFGKQFPERFVQCFIAEQNMISVAVGMQRRGKVPYAATFGAFFTRAHDQIRMAAIGNAALRLVGSHAGISIGQDGPSQMALEDIALMRGLSDSVVLYPSDAVSASKLTVLMHSYKKGISYLRTTRMATPVLYGVSTPFNIGGCAVLREYPDATACIIGAGVTLHEALKAHDLLAKQGVKISVIDLYSVKPLDRDTIIRVATASNKRIITVEDHYHAGGIGETVAATVADTGIHVKMLAVPGLPRSGSPAELLAWAGIDAEGIIKEVKKQ